MLKTKHFLILTVDGNEVNPIEQGNEWIRSCNTDGPLFVGGIPGMLKTPVIVLCLLSKK